MDRELSERIVVSPGACKEEELGDIDRELRDFLEIGAGLNHRLYGLETGRWIKKTMIRDRGLERKSSFMFICTERSMAIGGCWLIHGSSS
jgi:hypothetical protein